MPELPDGLTARPMTVDDLPAAAELLADAEPVDDTGEHLDAGDLAEWWVEDLVDLPRDGRAVCTDDGTLVAIAVVVSTGGGRKDHRVLLKGQAHLGHLGVLRPARRRGIASAAIVAALRAGASAGCHTAGLQVDTGNPTGAFRLYQRLGFAPLRTRAQWTRTLPPVP